MSVVRSDVIIEIRTSMPPLMYSCEEDGDLCVFPVCDEGHDGGGTGRTNTQRRRR
ncbi:hypothetical protein MTR_7g104280 [Medicago truncatula]|uniref:Uncharacterized protein n=1 Tax=Medicago truncatula TaxID=3880 RepID=G7L610_MEDTR|nr:hypothetical protein MTR_7g104280 [Medicago truncatula]